MTDKVIKILVFCLIALFALAGIFFVTSLVLDYAKAPVIAQDSVNLLIDDVHKASQYYQVGTPQFSDLLKTNVSSRGNVVAATVAGLASVRTVAQAAKIRGIDEKDILG